MYLAYIQPDKHIFTKIRYNVRSSHQTIISPLIPLRFFFLSPAMADDALNLGFSNYSVNQNHVENSVKHTDFLVPPLRVAGSIGLG